MRRCVVLLVVLGCGLAGMAGISPALAAASSAPVGAFDVAAQHFAPVVPGRNDDGAAWTFSGWAADRDAPGGTLDVHLWINGMSWAVTRTGDPRPDVARALPWAGGASGWHFTFDAAGFDPDSVVCAYALDVPAGGPATPLGCHDLRQWSPGDPVGTVDAAYASPGMVEFHGWVGDPDGAPTTRIHVTFERDFVSGNVLYFGNEPVEWTADRPRPDVKAVYAGLSLTTGFDLRLPVPPGERLMCLTAENTGGGTHNLDLGCFQGTIPDVNWLGPHDPRGNMDPNRTACRSQSPCTWPVDGWAFDPDTSAPVTVRIRAVVVTHDASGAARHRQRTRILHTGVPRDDVPRLVPGAGPNTGFHGDVGQTDPAGGTELVCAYAVNVGPGGDQFIGCRRGPR